MRDDDGAAVSVDGMVQLLVDLLQTVSDGLPFPLGQGSPTTASGGIIVDMPFQWCVTEQVGMEYHTGITLCIEMKCGGYFEHFSRIDQSQGSSCPVFVRAANQRVEIARHTQILTQLVSGEIGKTDQRMQRFLFCESVEQIYRNDIIRILLAQIHIFFD